MSRTQLPHLLALTLAALGAVAAPGHASAQDDFGVTIETMLSEKSLRLFGIEAPLAEPADEGDYVPREEASAGERLLVAEGLSVQFVTRKAAQDADMFAFWPNGTQLTHLIFCIEQGRSGTTPAGDDGLNPSVQRIEVATGEVETILHGMDRCDGIRRTPWGTLIASEETDDGRIYEIIRPLTTTGHWVADRATGDVRSAIDGTEVSQSVVQRQALPTMAWEGIAVLGSGVVIGGDELRPGEEGDMLDADGGAIFKFVPDVPHDGSRIDDLSLSPLVSGTTWAMTISCFEADDAGFPQYGQGCEVGVGAWVKVGALTARTDADARGATGYYRPEDLHTDTGYTGEGVQVCWTNTGREDAFHYSEVMCAVDNSPLPETQTEIVDDRTGFVYLGEGDAMTTIVANRLIEGDTRFNSFDNLHVQPGSGLVYVIEDHDFGEVFACLRDGADRDLKSDGCVSVASVVDPEAEPTGFEFSDNGRVAIVSIQHGEQPEGLLDFESNPVDGTTDDILIISGFRRPQ